MRKRNSQRKRSILEKIFPFLLIISLAGWIGSFWYGFTSCQEQEKKKQLDQILHFLETDQVRADAKSYCQSRIAFLDAQGGSSAAADIAQLKKDIINIDRGNIFYRPSKDGISWDQLLNDAVNWNRK